ncbi:hypothetical protein SK355_10295 [Candidatus Fukatsuia symbiotica]|uniref:Uncharacterized protein n=1 Tax=Candidatus Fukatsuia symbiotica TaxID=1878942 RepID=A0A2U8I3P9_9GAMM|nr:hypothetical protein [Candidatus Fukatsuia symbiotica]AWK13743.1 hypothetical protein CCS41_03425 [Candidatus Fukatsuia symbiotica]MEA9445585.1 hypothetical protein [Candidatus Fukatsuia symbiotica]
MKIDALLSRMNIDPSFKNELGRVLDNKKEKFKKGENYTLSLKRIVGASNSASADLFKPHSFNKTNPNNQKKRKTDTLEQVNEKNELYTKQKKQKVEDTHAIKIYEGNSIYLKLEEINKWIKLAKECNGRCEMI